MVKNAALVILGVASVTLVGAGIALAMRERAKNGNGEAPPIVPPEEVNLQITVQEINFIKISQGNAQIPVSAVLKNLSDMAISNVELRMDVIEDGSFGVLSLGQILLLPNISSLEAGQSKVASQIKNIDVLPGATYRAVVFATVGGIVVDQQEFELLS